MGRDLSTHCLVCISSWETNMSFSSHTVHRPANMGLQVTEPLSNFHATLQFGFGLWCLVCRVEEKETMLHCFGQTNPTRQKLISLPPVNPSLQITQFIEKSPEIKNVCHFSLIVYSRAQIQSIPLKNMLKLKHKH